MSENESDNEEAQDTTVNAGIDRTEEWAALRAKYLLPAEERPASNARGVHHMVLMCSDVEETIKFYQGVLGFPLTEIFENRDYPGSTHFFSTLETVTSSDSSTSRGSVSENMPKYSAASITLRCR